MLWFMGSQRVGHDWVTKLNRTESAGFSGKCPKAPQGDLLQSLGYQEVDTVRSREDRIIKTSNLDKFFPTTLVVSFPILVFLLFVFCFVFLIWFVFNSSTNHQKQNHGIFCSLVFTEWKHFSPFLFPFNFPDTNVFCLPLYSFYI